MMRSRLFSLGLFVLLAACKPAAESGKKVDHPPIPKAQKGDKGADHGPVDLKLAPFAGGEKLPTGASLVGPDGKKQDLSDLLADRNLVLTLTDDGEDRQTRAATRMLRDIVKAGRGGGFKVLAIFPEGTDAASLPNFIKKRGLDENVQPYVDHEGDFAEATKWVPRTAALVDGNGTIANQWGPTERWDERIGFEPGLSADLLAQAFAGPPAPTLDSATKGAAVELVRTALRTPWTGLSLPDAVRAKAATAGLGGAAERGVWVTLYRRGSTEPSRAMAKAGTLGEAIAMATQKALAAAPEPFRTDAAALRFSVDVPGAEHLVPTRHMQTLWFLLESGVDGVVVRRDGKDGVTLPQEAVTRGLLSPRVMGRNKAIPKVLEFACKEGGFGKDCWKDSGTELLRFRTAAFGVSEPDGPALDQYRGNVLVEDRPLTEAEILESIRLGGLWLLRTVMPDGKFDYEYYPNEDKGSTDYNIVRHAGSVYGLFEMSELARMEPALAADRGAYLDAAARAMGFVVEGLESPKEAKEPGRLCLIDRKRCESGSAALSLLTFLSRPAPEHVPAELRDRIFPKNDKALTEGLALTLLDMIDDRGRVYAKYSEAATGKGVTKEPLYYPGESMLALVRFHQMTGDPRWLEGARRIGDWQVQVYEKDRFEFPDHWVMQALYRLWQVTKDDRYARTAFSMSTHSVSEQYPFMSGPFPDYFGSWRRRDDIPRTTRAASRMEAIRAVVELGWEHKGGGEDQRLWEDSLLHAARHMMEQQFRPVNSFWVARTEKTEGAYRMGIVDNHCRIDNNQHGLVGMVGALEVVRHRAGAPWPPAGGHSATPTK